MDFENKMPEWTNEGTEPSADLKTNGFKQAYKPPAGVFNWFWAKVSKAITELQTKVVEAYNRITPIANGGTGASTTGKARENLSLNVMTFNNLSQIGIKEGQETIESIVAALPLNSRLETYVGSSNAEIYPETYGLLTVQKIANNRTYIEFMRKGHISGLWIGSFDTDSTPNWSGWCKVYTTTNKPTIEEIGAAPSGYGWGEENGKPCTDCNAALLPGFYCLSGESTINGPSEYYSMRFGSLFVEKRHATIYQTITYNNVVAKRYSLDSGATWEAWEFVNPPMKDGVEYRTTERFGQKPVYAKYIYTADVSDGKSVDLDTELGANHTTLRSCVRVGIYPWCQGTEIESGKRQYHIGAKLLTVNCTPSFVGLGIHATIWYVKN